MQELHASIRSQLAVQASDLRALAQRLTSGPEAEDCVQDTMVAALSQHEPPRKLRPWLRQVLRNEIHAQHRVGSRRRHREHAIGLPDPVPTLDDRAQREQIAAALHTVLDTLEEPYRSTLRQRFLLEHPSTRIAEEQGCSPATVRWRVHEGLRRMRRMLDERFEGRQQWLGGMALLTSWPVEGAAPIAGAGADTTMTATNTTTTTTMTPSSIGALLTMLALAGIAVGATILTVNGVEATPASRTEPAQPSVGAALVGPGALAPAPSFVERGHEVDAAIPCDEGSCDLAAPKDDALVAQAGDIVTALTYAGGDAHSDVLREALQACLAADPEHAWPRLELGFDVVGGAPGEPAYFANVEVTTGREAPCLDPVDQTTPADAPGVVRHPELVACLLEAAMDGEPQGFDPLEPGESRPFMMVFVDHAEDPPSPDGPLPTADEALAATEPEHAPAVLGLPALGSTSDDAIAVVECMDYDCPFCRRSQSDVTQLLDEHPEVAFHVLHNPLAMHPGASLAARAAVAAGDQDHFWQMHEALFEDPEARTVPTVVAKAAALGLDVERFEADLLSEDIGRRVATQAAVCTNAGARGTPSFFVGGDLLVGAHGYEALAESVVFELSQR